MNEQNDHDLLSVYRSLPSEGSTAPEMEARIVRRLRHEGLIRSHISAASVFKIVAAIAACVIFFLSGIYFEKQRIRSTTISMTEQTFAFFLMEDDNYQSPANESEMQERIALYRDWGRKLREQGIVVNGTKLQEQRHVFNARGEEPQRKELTVAGYFLIDAGDYAKAVEIARTCPHLRFGGKIEVRQIHPV